MATGMFRSGAFALSALAAAVIAFHAPSASAEMALWFGGEYATGDYGVGGEDIEDIYVPVTLDVEGEKLLLRLTVPYAGVSGPEGSIWISDTFVPGEGPDVSESGLGDIIASLTAKNLFVSDDGALVVDLTGTVKLGTADEEKGLGTGENDYSAQVDVYRLLENATLYATAGYKVRGEPEEFDLDDTWFVGAGGLVLVGDASSLGVGVNYRPEVVSNGDPASELMIFGGRQLTNGWRIHGQLLVGLADGSPDWGAGFRIKIPL